jgi:hypothetical protein
MVISDVPAPWMRAPILFSTRASSSTSGSQAQFLQGGAPAARAAGHHQVLGAGDRHHVEHDGRPSQAAGAGVQVPVLQPSASPQRLQALQVLVDRPRADGAAAGQRDHRLTLARQQRPSTSSEARIVFTDS